MNNEVSLCLNYTIGILPYLLNEIENLNINIISIKQDVPITDSAIAHMSLNLYEHSIEEIMKFIKNIKGVNNVEYNI